MNTIGKIVVALMIAMAAVAVWLAISLAQLNKRHAAETIRLELALSECKYRECAATATIERQNKAIEAVRVDTAVIEKRVNSVIDKYSYIRETVRVNTERDTSCESKIDNIDFVLRRFSGVELRAARSNEN